MEKGDWVYFNRDKFLDTTWEIIIKAYGIKPFLVTNVSENYCDVVFDEKKQKALERFL